MQQWTQDEAIEYECARETITHLRAIITSQITDETTKDCPNFQRLSALRNERSRLFRERLGLHVKDHVEISRVNTEYGAKIRSWCAKNQANAT